MAEPRLGFLGLNVPVLRPERCSLVEQVIRGRRYGAPLVVPSMSYAKKNKKKKKLMKKGLIKKPEDTRLLDLPLPESLEGSIAIVWFRRDLRVLDNEALRLANTADRTGAHQAAFLKQSVLNLRRNLRMRATDLYIRTGRPEKIIAEICKEYLGVGLNVNVVAQKEVTKEETTVEFLLQRSLKRLSKENAKARLNLVWGATLHHIEDLPYTASNFFPISFTTFKQRMDRKRKQGMVRTEIPAPDIMKPAPEPEIESGECPHLVEDLQVSGLMEPANLEKPYPHPQACFPFDAGEDAALERLNEYIWKKDGFFYYADTRNAMGYSDFSLKLSPYLALGCVSPRTVYWQTMKFQDLHPRREQQGSAQLEVQLQWRDFFRLAAVVYKNQLFARDGLGQRDKRGRLTARTFAKREPTDEMWEKIRRWMDGNTGMPFIDAAMREMNKTGYMSNRCRQNCASYLMHDIGCPDWRIGAEYFQSKLIDHDVTSNWMGWQYIAGVSNDPKHGKRYPVLKQALTYDYYGLFVMRWCGELANVPAPEIHAPFLLSEEELEAYNVKLSESYPDVVAPAWRVPEEISRDVETAQPEPSAPRRKPRLEQEVEELVGGPLIEEEEPEEERGFFREMEEHIDDDKDFYTELMSLDEDDTEDAEDAEGDEADFGEEEGLGDVSPIAKSRSVQDDDTEEDDDDGYLESYIGDDDDGEDDEEALFEDEDDAQKASMTESREKTSASKGKHFTTFSDDDDDADEEFLDEPSKSGNTSNSTEPTMAKDTTKSSSFW